MKFISILPWLFILTGCGASSSGDSEPQGLVNVTNVSGNYSLITSAISASCTDGSSDTLPAISLIRAVTHNNQEFVLSGGSSSVPGITVLEADPLSGVVQASGKFVGTSVILAQIDGIEGNVTVSYNLSGYFNDSGWAGDYEYSIYYQSYYSTTFEGYKD